jgi:heme-degrading monooxygenase HmoA
MLRYPIRKEQDMAVVLTLSWPGATKEQYDQLRELVRWDEDPATNGIFHVAWWEGDTMMIVDVWESQQDWQDFFDNRLAQHFPTAGVTGEPDAQLHEVHRYFNTETARAAA